MSNPLVTVLCTAALCCAVLGNSPWAAGFLVMAFPLAMWQNWISSKVITKWLKK